MDSWAVRIASVTAAQMNIILTLTQQERKDALLRAGIAKMEKRLAEGKEQTEQEQDHE